MTSCYICGRKEGHIDDHHVDRAHGQFSDETVPLCRRCHWTYHTLGVEWFDDDFLDRAIEVENKRRALHKLPPMLKEEVKRSAYWYKAHGMTREMLSDKKEVVRKVEDKILAGFVQKCITPLCGWDWLAGHRNNEYPEQWIEIKFDNEPIAKVAASAKRGAVRKVMRLAGKH